MSIAARWQFRGSQVFQDKSNCACSRIGYRLRTTLPNMCRRSSRAGAMTQPMPSFGAEEFRLARTGRAGADDLLQGDDVGIDVGQDFGDPLGPDAAIQSAAAMDVVGDDAHIGEAAGAWRVGTVSHGGPAASARDRRIRPIDTHWTASAFRNEERVMVCRRSEPNSKSPVRAANRRS